jgi:hypothetical protein
MKVKVSVDDRVIAVRAIGKMQRKPIKISTMVSKEDDKLVQGKSTFFKLVCEMGC